MNFQSRKQEKMRKKYIVKYKVISLLLSSFQHRKDVIISGVMVKVLDYGIVVSEFEL